MQIALRQNTNQYLTSNDDILDFNKNESKHFILNNFFA